MDSNHTDTHGALSIADPVSLSESPFAQYLAGAGLDDEVDATIADEGDIASQDTETIRAGWQYTGSERRWWIPSVLGIGGGIAAVGVVGWVGWVRPAERLVAGTKMMAGGMIAGTVTALASAWSLQRRLARAQVKQEARQQVNGDCALDLAWANLDKALTSRYRYLREVDLVSRGYKLQSHALPSAWAADSFRKLDHRKLLVSCLKATARAAVSVLAVVPNAPALDSLHGAVDKLVSDATAEYALGGIKDLLSASREIVAIVFDDAELVPMQSLNALTSTFESVTHRLLQSDPFATPGSVTSSAAAPAAPRSSPIASNLALVHAHLHTMHIKTHLALTETHEDRIALAAYLTAMSADVEYLSSLLAHLRSLADGPHAPASDARLPDGDVDGNGDATWTRSGTGRAIMADEEMVDTLDAEAWTGEVDLEDEGEVTLRPARSTLTREERIALRKQQLAEQAAARVAMSSTMQFVGELKNVLGQRRGHV